MFLLIIPLLLTPTLAANGREIEIPLNEYLTRYGFMEKIKGGGAAHLIDPTEALLDYQRMYDLPQTGRLDERTSRLMKTPRCAVPDKGAYVDIPKRKRKRSLLTKWKKTNLTYFVANHPSYMDYRLVDSVVWNSFLQWQNISTLTFRPARSIKDADIIISFPSPYEHANCTSSFASPDLAHAFFPENGRVHFNMDFRWDEPGRLPSVTVHELGHAIGLPHSRDSRSVMYAMNTPDPKHITTVEINELRESYGPKAGLGFVEEDSIVRETEDEMNTPPDPCNATIDAAFRRRGEYVFFKGGWMWRFTPDTNALVGNRLNRINQFYSGVNRVDAAMEVEDQVFLFTGSEVRVQVGGSMSGAVSLRTFGIRDSDKIDNAFAWYGVKFDNGPGIYLIDDTNNVYYRFDGHRRQIVQDSKKSRSLQWSNIPKSEAAFNYGPNQDLVFVQGKVAHIVSNTTTGSTRIAKDLPLADLFGYCRKKAGVIDIPSKRETTHEDHHHHHHHHHHSRSMRLSSTVSFSRSLIGTVVLLIVFVIY